MPGYRRFHPVLACFVPFLLVAACQSSTTQDAPAAGSGAGTAPVVAGISTVEVATTGRGSSRDAAIRDALLRAVESVHGRAISVTTVSQELGTKEKRVDKSIMGIGGSKSDIERSTVGGRTVEEATRGLVTSMRILEEDEGGDSWTVKLIAGVAKFTPPGAGKPTVIVGTPRSETSAPEAAVVLRNRVADALSQGGKVALLDRSADGEIAAELALAGSEAAAATEALKQGQLQVADIAVLLSIDALAVDRASRTLRMTGREIVSYAGRADASFRVVHVATRQILASGRATATRGSEEALRDDINADAWRKEMMEEVAGDIARQVTNALITASGAKGPEGTPASAPPAASRND